jgi:hypothetical protein
MPITDDYGQGVSSLAYGESPDLQVMGEGLLAGLVPRSVMRFASASARAATITSPVEGMVTWRQDANVLEVYDGASWVTPPPNVATTASGATASSGFSLVSFSAYKISGVMAMVNIAVTRTGSTINADSAGNLADTELATLPSGYRPPEPIYAGVGDGFGAGECSIGTDGAINLRAWSSNGAIVAGRNLRITKTFMAPQ